MYTQEITVNNEVGLHARPATFFIQKANEFKSGIWVEKDDRRVNAKSLLGVLSLGIVKGTKITLIADGTDEKEAVGALVEQPLWYDEELLGIEKESCIMYTQEITVNNEVGLHARPATFFIQKANEFKSGIWVEKDDRRVNAKSLLGVLSLGIVKGTTITLIADGADEKEAVGALVDLVKDNFGE